jgi:hypothetical protein
MQILTYRRRLALCTAATALLGGASALAQTISTSSAVEEIDEQETIILSPFTVEADEDTGYQATATLAGTRIRTDLKDVGSAIQVITKDFLRDTGARNAEDLLIYTTNTETGGPRGNFAGLGGGSGLDEGASLLRPNQNNRVRGLASADNTRDFFLSDIPWDSYNVGRVDLQRGPNSVLFGLGKPAGIINSSTNGASFRDGGEFETRLSSYGGYRASVDYNKVLLNDELAIRIDGLKESAKFRQQPAFSRDERVFGALRYDPSFLNQGSAHTSIKINYEDGKIESNRPRTLPPIDRITPFFNSGFNQQTYDPIAAQVDGVRSASSANYNPYLGDLFGGPMIFLTDPAAGTFADVLQQMQSDLARNGIGPNGSIDGSVGGLQYARMQGILDASGIAANLNLPFKNDFKQQLLSDASIFDFYNLLIDGPNKREFRDFNALNVSISQTFWDDRVGIEAAFYDESYSDAQHTLLNNWNTGLQVDVNTHFVDGSPNPNVGRPMLVTRSTYTSTGRSSDRETTRLTGFAELDFSDFMERDSWLTRLLGKHTFTGLYTEDSIDRRGADWANYALDQSYTTFINTASNIDPNREVQIVTYLGESLLGASSASGLQIGNLSGLAQFPTAVNVNVFDSNWNRPTNASAAGYVNPAAAWTSSSGTVMTQSENPANYEGWGARPFTLLDGRTSDIDELHRGGRKDRDRVTSQAIVWQGRLFDGLVVPMAGLRKDRAKAWTAQAPSAAGGYKDLNDPSFVLPDDPYNDVSGTSKTYSVVVHTPKSLREKTPWGSHVSFFYNKSENFEPAAGRIDPLGNPLAAPSGKTEDYGVVISTLNDRLSLKINWYETSAANATGQLGLSNWFIGAVESRAWVAAKRFEAGLNGATGPGFNYESQVDGVWQTTAADRALQQAHVSGVLSAFSPEMASAWGWTTADSKWQNSQWDPWSSGGFEPPGITATVDTVSKGEEFELYFRPTDSWNIAINASHTTAQRTNIANSLAEWVDERNLLWNGPVGDIRMWNGRGTNSIKNQWNSTFYRRYQLQQLLSGANVPELRPWRFNVISNYRFSGDRFKGVNVGGSFRWEDRVAIGYPSISTPDGDSFDLASPYWGPKDTHVDLWVGYDRKLTDKIKWRLQLNVRDVFASDTLIPITTQPDGTIAAARIPPETTWSVTNTFSF